MNQTAAINEGPVNVVELLKSEFTHPLKRKYNLKIIFNISLFAASIVVAQKWGDWLAIP